ncbi:MAG TPA: hypothetical protein DEQ02_02855, partial [Ruminococcaceae bacterium]|nr:hypothetical protein [Oscillospiraceae bacterium]
WIGATLTGQIVLLVSIFSIICFVRELPFQHPFRAYAVQQKYESPDAGCGAVFAESVGVVAKMFMRKGRVTHYKAKTR